MEKNNNHNRNIIKVNTKYENPEYIEDILTKYLRNNKEECKNMNDDTIYENYIYGTHLYQEIDKDEYENILNLIYYSITNGLKQEGINVLLSLFKKIIENIGIDYNYISLNINDNIYVSSNEDKFVESKLNESLDINRDNENKKVKVEIEDTNINDNVKIIPENTEFKETVNLVKVDNKEIILEKSGQNKNKIDIKDEININVKNNLKNNVDINNLNKNKSSPSEQNITNNEEDITNTKEDKEKPVDKTANTRKGKNKKYYSLERAVDYVQKTVNIQNKDEDDLKEINNDDFKEIISNSYKNRYDNIKNYSNLYKYYIENKDSKYIDFINKLYCINTENKSKKIKTKIIRCNLFYNILNNFNKSVITASFLAKMNSKDFNVLIDLMS